MPESDRTPRRVPLWKEITVILVIKAAALYLIWLAFFSYPLDKQPNPAGTAKSLLRPASPSAGPPSR